MTIQKAIDKVQTEKPNTFGTEKLLEYINEAEAVVAEQMQKRFQKYTTSDLNKELLAPFPYDCLYVSYLKAQIDYAHEEYPSYQLNQEQYSADMEEFIDWVVRTNHVETDLSFPRRLFNIM